MVAALPQEESSEKRRSFHPADIVGLAKKVLRMMQMEKLLNHCDMELMKMAMLKHEETFRQQVHELHRLYRVQKQLMTGLSSGQNYRRPRRKHPRRALDLHLPADEFIVTGGLVRAAPPSRDDGLELTLAVGGGGGRRKRRDRSTAAATPLASSDCSGGGARSPSSSSSTGSPYQRAVSFRVQEGPVVRQQQQAPWLVHCLSLRMA